MTPAAPQAPAPLSADWQPIATAPNDGTEVLLWCGRVEIGSWNHTVRIRNGKVEYEHAGWSLRTSAALFGSGEPQPTHWAPMLGRPVEAAHPVHAAIVAARKAAA